MSRININGIEYYECFHCGHWTHELICGCREEGKSKQIVKLMNIFRKRNEVFVFTTPYHGGKS